MTSLRCERPRELKDPWADEINLRKLKSEESRDGNEGRVDMLFVDEVT